MSLFNRFFGKKLENQADTSNAEPEPRLESKPLTEAIESIPKLTSPNRDRINPEPSAAEPETINTPWRTFSIFISSTFADMQAERDLLKNIVFPKVEEELQKRRIKLEIVDLRWGVDTTSMAQEDEREANVLKVCLDEIRRCRPFFIGLLGDRYGWVPPMERMVTALAGEKHVVPEKGKSVTDLEIEFGVLASQQQLVRSVFYFREPLPYATFSKKKAAMFSDEYNNELSEAEKKERKTGLIKLKAKIVAHFIKNKLENKVKTYSGNWDVEKEKLIDLESWGDVVYADILAECENHAKETWDKVPQNWQEQELALLNAFIEQHTHITTTITDGKPEQVNSFCGREELLKELTMHLLSDDYDNWGKVLTGESGSGKSAVFSMVCKLMEERKDCFVLAHSAGLSPRAKSVADLLKIWNRQLAIFTGLEEEVSDEIYTDDLHSFQMPGQPNMPQATPIEKLQEKFLELLQIVSAKKRVLLLIDALDRFEPTPRAQHLSWLPTVMPKNVRVLCTAITGTEQKATQYHKGLTSKSIEIFSKEEAQEMLNALCKKNHKTLAEKVRRIILEKKREDGELAISSPLWLSLAANMLMALDQDDFEKISKLEGSGGEQIDAYLARIAKEFDPLPGPLFISLTQKAGVVFGDTFTKTLFYYLAISRNGLREKDLEKLLNDKNWDPLQFANLRRLFKNHLALQGDEMQWNLAHSTLRNALIGILSDRGKYFHQQLAFHFLSLDFKDTLHCSETMYHLLECNSLEFAADYYSSGLTHHEEVGSTNALCSAITNSNMGLSRAIDLIRLVRTNEKKFQIMLNNYLYKIDKQLGNEGNFEVRIKIITELDKFFNDSYYYGKSEYSFYKSDIMSLLGILHALTGQTSEALKYFEIDFALCTKLFESNPNKILKGRLADSCFHLGAIYSRLGQEDEALKYCEIDIKLSKELYASDPYDESRKYHLIMSYISIGNTHQLMGHLNEALISFESQIRLSEEKHEAMPRNNLFNSSLALSYVNISGTYEDMGKFEDALELCNKGINILLKLYNSNPNYEVIKYSLLISYSKLGSIHHDIGHIEEALKIFEITVKLSTELCLSSPSSEEYKKNLAISYSHLGTIHKEMGQMTEALNYFNKCYFLVQELFNSHSQDDSYKEGLVSIYSKLGDIYEAEGNLKEALKYFEDFKKISESLFKSNTKNQQWKESLAISYNRLGSINKTFGHIEGCISYFEDCAEVFFELYSSNPFNLSYQRNLANIYSDLGYVYKEINNLKEALKYFHKYHDFNEESYTKESLLENSRRNWASSCYELASIYEDMGQLEEALKYQEELCIIGKEICQANQDNFNLLEGLGECYYSIAKLKRLLGNETEGEWYLKEGERIFTHLFEINPNINKYGEKSERLNEGLFEYQQGSLGYSNSKIGVLEDISNIQVHFDKNKYEIDEHISQNNYSEALRLLIRQEEFIRKKKHNAEEFQANMGEQGNILLKLGKYKDALQKFEIQGEVCARNRWDKVYASSLISQAEIFLKHLNKPKQAKILLIEAIAVAEDNKLDQIIQDAESMLKEIK